MPASSSAARLVGVGVFVLGTLLLFAIGLFMIGDRQMAFADEVHGLYRVQEDHRPAAGRDRPRVGREGGIDHIDLAADLAERQVPG